MGPEDEKIDDGFARTCRSGVCIGLGHRWETGGVRRKGPAGEAVGQLTFVSLCIHIYIHEVLWPVSSLINFLAVIVDQPFRLVLLSDLSSERKMCPRFFFVLAGLGEKDDREVLKLMGVGGT